MVSKSILLIVVLATCFVAMDAIIFTGPRPGGKKRDVEKSLSYEAKSTNYQNYKNNFFNM
jgi:hypothetical protein